MDRIYNTGSSPISADEAKWSLVLPSPASPADGRTVVPCLSPLSSTEWVLLAAAGEHEFEKYGVSLTQLFESEENDMYRSPNADSGPFLAPSAVRDPESIDGDVDLLCHDGDEAGYESQTPPELLVLPVPHPQVRPRPILQAVMPNVAQVDHDREVAPQRPEPLPEAALTIEQPVAVMQRHNVNDAAPIELFFPSQDATQDSEEQQIREVPQSEAAQSTVEEDDTHYATGSDRPNKRLHEAPGAGTTSSGKRMRST